MPDVIPGKMQEGVNTAGALIEQGATVRQIQTSYTTAVAVQKPRDLVEVEKRCLMEAALAGEACFYGWGSGKNRVDGSSKECAMIAYRNWGNMAMEMRDIHETPAAYIMTAVIVDLETGTHYPRQFRQSKKWVVAGRMEEVRKEDIRFQIGQTKTQRNCILNFLPKWLTDKMVDRAKKGVREKLEAFIKTNSIEAARKLSLDALVKLGVKLERIEEKYGKKYGAWDIETLITLKGDIRALSDGAESADALFPENATDDAAPADDGGSLKTEDMTSGDAATHQGYDAPKNEKADNRRDELMKEPKPKLVERAAAALANAFVDDVSAGDAFIEMVIEKNILADADLQSDKNNKGHLVRFIMALGERSAPGQDDQSKMAGF